MGTLCIVLPVPAPKKTLLLHAIDGAQEQTASVSPGTPTLMVSPCTPTPTLTFVGTVDGRGAPPFLVEAGAAAVARRSARVVFAIALEPGQKKRRRGS